LNILSAFFVASFSSTKLNKSIFATEIPTHKVFGRVEVFVYWGQMVLFRAPPTFF
jgi:hypothetical protein